MRIDFYHISDPDYWYFACRIVAKAYQNHCQSYVYVVDESSADKMDVLLWTYKQQSFIPHAKVGVYQDVPPLIEIGCQPSPSHHRQLLINLSMKVPDFISQFNRVIEIVANNQQHKALADEHLAIYKAQGFTVNHYDLKV